MLPFNVHSIVILPHPPHWPHITSSSQFHLHCLPAFPNTASLPSFSAAFPLGSLSLYRFLPCTAGMLLDLLSPLYPPAFLPLLCIGSISRAISECNASELSIQLAFAIQSGDGGVGRLSSTPFSPSPSLPPVFSAPTFLPAGTASGATRAALTQHFALQQNAADISAKVSSPVDDTWAERSGTYVVTAYIISKLIQG